MSMAFREAQCLMLSRSLAGQSGLMHLWAASPSGRTTGPPHTGQASGIRKGAGLFSLSRVRLAVISGITSPALLTETMSPVLTSLRFTSSRLCRVALVTVTPPTSTGASSATGVSFPVLPT